MKTNRTESMENAVLWEDLEDILDASEATLRAATRSRKLGDLGSMVAPMRRAHWLAAFLGLTDLADIAALTASFLTQLQEPRRTWSVELIHAAEVSLRRMRAFLDARDEDSLSGVFVDADKSVVHGPPLKRSVPTEDILAMYRRRQLDKDIVSSCRQLSVGKDDDFSHAITIPAAATRRHDNGKWLTLVYLDLDFQDENKDALIAKLEKAVWDGDILLHGPLGLPWRKWRDRSYSRPYYLLVDSNESVEDWLDRRSLDGRAVKELRQPENGSSGAPRVIIREVVPVEAAPVIRRVKTVEQPRMESPEAELIPLNDRRTEKRRKKIRNRDLKIRFPVGMKLILIVSLIIISSMSALTYVASYFFIRETRSRVDENNISLSTLVASQTESSLLSILDSAILLFQVGAAGGPDAATLVDDFFANSRNLIYVGIPGTEWQFTNRTWFRNNRVSNEEVLIESLIRAEKDSLDRAKNQQRVVINVSPYLQPNINTPVLALGEPYTLGTESNALIILADVGESIAKSVRQQGSIATSFVVNADGELLAHPELPRILLGESFADSPVVTEVFSQGQSRGQVTVRDRIDGEAANVMAAYSMISTGNLNLGVITTVREADAFEAVLWIQRLNIYLLGGVLSLAILGVYFYSRSLSNPLKELALATRRIKAGNFRVDLVPRSRDEVGQLTRTFIDMSRGLEAKDRLQDELGSFVNPAVAQMAADGRLPEHGETRDVTVFFSDVRGFTAMSEEFGDPEVVLDTLSEYFEAMVPCVNETQGMVDKFIGDAVMAVWGSMYPMPNHAENAINGALQMREALTRFNAGRGGPGRPKFQIGCGLNSGPATVGLMGPTTKKEWAHMGDTVNLASRIEGLNKPMGTDILISQSTADKVKGIYQLVPMNKIKVKGKTEPQQIYAVLGRLDDPHRPRSLDEMRAMLGIEGDFGKTANVEEKEVKYEILDS